MAEGGALSQGTLMFLRCLGSAWSLGKESGRGTVLAGPGGKALAP